MNNAGLVLILSVLGLIFLVARWRVFTKAGQSGWMSIIPYLEQWIELRITGRSDWWAWLGILFPPTRIADWILNSFHLARAFGYGWYFGLGLCVLPFVFFPILAFSAVRYRGPDGGGVCLRADTPPFLQKPDTLHDRAQETFL